MSVLEKEIEQYLTKKVKAIGGLCMKWVSPGNRGVPDRIVMFQGGVWFVEMKRTGEQARALQEVMHEKLKGVGMRVFVIDSKDGVDEFINMINSRPETIVKYRISI